MIVFSPLATVSKRGVVIRSLVVLCCVYGLSPTIFSQDLPPLPVVVDVGDLEPSADFEAELDEQRGRLFYDTEPAGKNQKAGNIRLNLEGNIKLQALLELVEARLKWNLIYDAKIGDRPINVRAPNELPADALPALLSSVLRMENLALVDADIPGWRRIVDAGAMLGLAKPGDPQDVLERDGVATPVTRAFVLKHLNAEQVTTVVRPFLSKTGSNMLPVPKTKTVVVTDFAPVLLTVERLLELLDQPPGEAQYRVYSVKNLPSGKLADQVKSMLGVGDAADNQGAASVATVGLFDEARTNQIVVVGTENQVNRALQLLERFDVSLGLNTVVYRLQHVKAERLNKIMQSFISPRDADRAFQSTIDAEGNLLIVRTTPEIHARLEELRQQIDQPVRSDESPIRFYKLKNANATDVLYTLLALQEVAGAGGSLAFGGAQASAAASETPAGGDGAAPPLSININSAQSQPQGYSGIDAIGAMAGVGGRGQPFGSGQFGMGGYGSYGRPTLTMPPNQYDNSTASYGNIQQFGRDRRSAVLAPQLATGGVAQLPGGARVSADIATNSLILVGRTEVQELYARLIESLDVRRPQVMIEAKIVAIDTSGDFSLGVEISGGDRTGGRRLFSFTSFGLSEVDPTDGSLSVTPSLGFNGALVDPSVADVVVKALSSHTRVNVIAEPRILVNDNATGQLESVTSVPFQSVNASDTVATTSLGGDQTAGTTITVTPRIKEDDHMHMEFSLEFSTFGEGGSAALPPPRQIDRVGSEITIPSGHTVIVGGLRRSNDSEGRTGIPFAESIPIIRQLTSLTTKNTSTTAFFVFLKPVILRDSQFDDLKYLSAVSAQDAGLPPEYPISQPVMIAE